MHSSMNKIYNNSVPGDETPSPNAPLNSGNGIISSFEDTSKRSNHKSGQRRDFRSRRQQGTNNNNTFSNSKIKLNDNSSRSSNNNNNNMNRNASNRYSQRSSYTLKNHAGLYIATHSSNQVQIRTNARPTNANQVNLTYKLGWDADKLYKTASVWASDFLGYGGVNTRSLFGENRSNWKQQLVNSFIYSYFRAFMLGVNLSYNERSLRHNDVFVGHHLFYNLLKSRRFSRTYEPGMVLNYSIELSYQEVESLRSKMCRDFPFLRECYTDDPGIGICVKNEQYDAILSSLKDHSRYTQRCMIGSLGNEDDNNFLSYLTDDSLFLGNCALSEDFNSILYVVQSLQDVFSESYALPRALFFYIKDSDVNTKQFYTPIDYNIYTIDCKYCASSIVGYKVTGEIGDDKMPNFNPTTPSGKGTDNEEDDTNDSIPDDDGIEILNNIRYELKEISDKNNGKISKDVTSSNIYEDVLSFNFNIKLLNSMLAKLNIVVNNDLSVSDLIIPFDINAKLEIDKLFNPLTVFNFISKCMKDGMRFALHNFKYKDNEITTIDNSIKLTFKNTEGNIVLTMKQIMDLLSFSWLAKKSSFITRDMLIKYVNNTYNITNKCVIIQNNYHITIIGGVPFKGSLPNLPVNLPDSDKF